MADIYEGSYLNAINIFFLSFVVWYLTDYNLFSIIAGINGVNHHSSPSNVSRYIDIFSNIIMAIYFNIYTGNILCHLFTIMTFLFYYKNTYVNTHININSQNIRHIIVQCLGMIVLYCGVKGY